MEFDQGVFDDGNCFDNTKDRFVAPVPGVYSFSVTLCFENPSFVNDTFHYIYLSKNGKRYCLLGEISSNEEVVVNNSVNLKLGVSDYIEILVNSPSLKIYGDVPYGLTTEMVHTTFFSGHLVYPTSY
ncbi:MAG: complement C1q domain-containing protein [Ignavibacteriales bacterium]|nr:complement C1q domain-containing protein [Ignavibacteriales bacterium]